MPYLGCSEAGVPGQIRTVDLALRRRALYPAELRERPVAERLVYLMLACHPRVRPWLEGSWDPGMDRAR
jgi:hypothetical protein